MSNYATKSDLKNAISVVTSQCAKKGDLANLKSELDKLYIDKLAEIDGDKLKPAPIDLKKLSDAVDKKVVKKDVCDELVEKINGTDTSKRASKTEYTGCY